MIQVDDCCVGIQAFADAFSSACTEGGFALAEQESFATAIVRPLVEVYALALGGASCGGECYSFAAIPTRPTALSFDGVNITSIADGVPSVLDWMVLIWTGFTLRHACIWLDFVGRDLVFSRPLEQHSVVYCERGMIRFFACVQPTTAA